MISFGAASFLFGALAVGIPIFLHLLKRKPKEIQFFPAFNFLHATRAAKQNKNHIRKWFVLFLRCLVLIFLACAFSWPYLPRFAERPETATVLLWDNSMSMTAKSYQEELMEKAVSLVEQANSKNPMLFGMISDEVDWSGDFSENAMELKSWFQNRIAGKGISRFESALRQAEAKLRGINSKNKRIVLITDFQTLPWQDVRLDRTFHSGIQFEVLIPEKPMFRNIAVTRAEITTPLTAPQQPLSLEVRARNFSNQPVSVHLATSWQNKEVDRRKIDLDAFSEVSKIISLQSTSLEAQGGSVRIIEEDEINGDNHAWFSVNPISPPEIYFSTLPANQADFLRVVFSASPEHYRVNLHDLNEQILSSELQQAALVILRDGLPLGTPLAEQLDQALRGGAHVVVLWKDSQAMRLWLNRYGISPALQVVEGTQRWEDIDFEHPIFRSFLDVRVGSLFDVLFFDPPSLTLPFDARILSCFADNKPAIAEMKVGQGTLFIVASELVRKKTDWPAHASFLPFWREMLSYNLNSREELSTFFVGSKALPIGEVREVQDLSNGENMVLKDGHFIPTEAGNFLIKFSEINRAISINVPTEESAPQFLPEDFAWEELVSKEKAEPDLIPLTQLPANQGRQYWWLLLFFVFVLMLGEVLLANRTAL